MTPAELEEWERSLLRGTLFKAVALKCSSCGVDLDRQRYRCQTCYARHYKRGTLKQYGR